MFLADPTAGSATPPAALAAAAAARGSGGTGTASTRGGAAGGAARPWLLAVKLHALPEALAFLDAQQHAGAVVSLSDLRLTGTDGTHRLFQAEGTDVRIAFAKLPQTRVTMCLHNCPHTLALQQYSKNPAWSCLSPSS